MLETLEQTKNMRMKKRMIQKTKKNARRFLPTGRYAAVDISGNFFRSSSELDVLLINVSGDKCQIYIRAHDLYTWVLCMVRFLRRMLRFLDSIILRY